MITDTDKKVILQIARKYRAKRVLLFGSSLSTGGESRDIDLAVEGIEGKNFFAFYGELLCALSKPVDVVDLSTESRFVQLIQQEGFPLYG